MDGYNTCNGVEIQSTNGAKLTTVSTEKLPVKPTTIITDFTSIAGKTLSNKNCDIPFLYNNASSYFCVLNQSRFICEVDKTNTFDYCNLGKKVEFVKKIKTTRFIFY